MRTIIRTFESFNMPGSFEEITGPEFFELEDSSNKVPFNATEKRELTKLLKSDNIKTSYWYYSPNGLWSGVKYKGYIKALLSFTQKPKGSKSSYKIVITKLDDDWYVVRIFDDFTKTGVLNFKCDEFSGLLDLIHWYNENYKTMFSSIK